MKHIIHIGKGIGAFLHQHWFKLAIGSLVLYTFFSRDLSLNISVHSPDEVKEQLTPLPSLHSSSRKETLTDNTLATEPKSDRFDFLPSWGSKTISLSDQLSNIEQQQIARYIERFAHVAQAEQEKFGVPSSITLAHGLLQSQAGTGRAASQGYNYFLTPCTEDWNGGTQDGPDGCVRRYNNAWLSFRDHSLYFTTGQHASLQQLDSRNYEGWAKAIGASPTNEIEDLASQIIFIIEKYQLFQYD